MNKALMIILDGFGVDRPWGGNAVAIAKMPQWNLLMKSLPHSILTASGKAVGLPGNEMGNSEVGHLTIGAGRVVAQDSTLINRSIQNDSFFSNKTLLKAFAISKSENSPIHLVGLLSDGGVHAAYNHLKALLILARAQSSSKTFIHIFTDGRDTEPYHAVLLVDRLQKDIADIGAGKIATLTGRYFAMDRDHHFDRTNKAVACLTLGVGDISNRPLKVISYAYQNGLSDEFIPPTVIVDDNRQPVGSIKNGDPIIFFNFRSDRARQLCQALVKHRPNSFLVTFVPYGFEKETGIAQKVASAFSSLNIKNGLAEYLSSRNLSQCHIAETEKYAHITYFFNGGVESSYQKEERVLVPSLKVAAYDLAPAMSAEKISQKIIRAVDSRRFDFIVANFANPDMVGHSGNLNATVAALEKIDSLLEEIIRVCAKKNTYVLITADHGNCEQMIASASGVIDTEHSVNPVPLVIVPPEGKGKIDLRKAGSLADVAPTVLEIMGLEKPAEMTGKSLIIGMK